jgi:methionyl aminopeptidase
MAGGVCRHAQGWPPRGRMPDMLVPEIRSGVTTEHINRLVFEFAMDYGAMPATLMYRSYAKGTQPPVSSIT